MFLSFYRKKKPPSKPICPLSKLPAKYFDPITQVSRILFLISQIRVKFLYYYRNYYFVENIANTNAFFLIALISILVGLIIITYVFIH